MNKSRILLTFLVGSFCINVNAAVISVIDTPSLIGSPINTSTFSSPQGDKQAYDSSGNIALNDSVVVSNTIPNSFSSIHDKNFIVDGFYGNGSSWIDSLSGSGGGSWLKIDLGASYLMDSLSFGRDRLGNFEDRDPGQFTIQTSLFDAVFADGNIADDASEYTTIVDSSALGFSGIISGNDTILSSFTAVEARFILMTFANANAAIDEVEITGVAVPEPSIISLFGAGILGLGFARRRKLRQS